MNRREFASVVGIGALARRSEPTPAAFAASAPSPGSLAALSAGELAQLIRARGVSATEVLEAQLERIAAYNPKLNAIVTLDSDRARQSARRADDALARGQSWGPLHGVPVTLEDAHATAGIRSTWGGFPDLAKHVPSEDGTVAARLKSAGAILLGKTNGPMIWPDSVFADTRNPWNPEHTPGRSSAGPAAAIAARLTPLDVGVDTIGSITVPSHNCGIYGMRPTEHRVPLTGAFFIDKVYKWRRMSVTGPMARSVSDLELVLRILAGPDGRDWEVPAVPWREAGDVRAKGLRIAWTASFPGAPMAADIRSGVAMVAEKLGRLGVHVEERLPAIDLGAQSDLADRLFDLVADSESEKPSLLRGYFDVLQQREVYMSAWDGFLAEWDAFLCPAACRSARRTDATDTVIDGTVVPKDQADRMGIPTALSPVNGCPAVALPIGTDRQGLPIGLLLIARQWQDERLLKIAQLVSDLTPGYHPPPGY
jgi:amidase